jgi:hypothetical protein
MRVIGWETRSRNEGDNLGIDGGPRGLPADPGGRDTGTTQSISVGTRKMVNYA